MIFGGVIYAQDDPSSTVEAFLNAWNTNDTATMYSLISPQSQELYPQPVFENRYQQVREIVGINGVTFAVNNVRLQGITAAVSYDVAIDSATFGTIDDPGRTMRLVNEGGRWLIAWSSMDIFAALAGDATLTTAGGQRTRASIYDRNGNVLVEDNGGVVLIYGVQDNMSNIDDCIDLITRLMRRDRDDVVAEFAQYNGDTIFFLGWMDAQIFANNSGNLNGTCGLVQDFTSTTNIRTYYGGNALTHVTGYVGSIPAERLTEFQALGYGAGDQVGLSGVEDVYEETLAGQPERILRIIEPGGTPLREFASTAGTAPMPISLTLDSRLQVIVADALNDAHNYAAPNWAGISTGASAVVLDVNTGGVLALASYPMVDPIIFNLNAGFDSSTYVAAANNLNTRPLINRATQEQYFPGSVYKIITLAAALNEGVITPQDTFDCQLEWERGVELGDSLNVRYDWRFVAEEEPAGIITPAQALMASCNPFFYEQGALVYRQAGGSVLDDYARQMGLGQTYTVNQILPGTSGNLGNPQSVTSAINNAIGQDPVQLPPIGMAVVTASVANGGTVYNPYLVQQIGGFDDVSVQETFSPQVLNTLDFQPGVLETIQEGMCGVPIDEDFGTATRIFGDAPYTLCGKTGTAEAGFAPNAWFVAYAPANDPQIAIAVAVANSREGSEVAAPIVRRILDDYFGVVRAPFPEWWRQEYTPVSVPEGATAAG